MVIMIFYKFVLCEWLFVFNLNFWECKFVLFLFDLIINFKFRVDVFNIVWYEKVDFMMFMNF